MRYFLLGERKEIERKRMDGWIEWMVGCLLFLLEDTPAMASGVLGVRIGHLAESQVLFGNFNVIFNFSY